MMPAESIPDLRRSDGGHPDALRSGGRVTRTSEIFVGF